MSGWVDEWMGGWMDGWMDGWVHRSILVTEPYVIFLGEILLTSFSSNNFTNVVKSLYVLESSSNEQQTLSYK